MQHSMSLQVRNGLSILWLPLFLAQPLWPPAVGQQPQPASGVPAQVAAGHAVFLANTEADPNFPIDSTRAYNDVYTALKARGLYHLVESPQQADLIFQLRDVAPITSVSGVYGSVSSATSPAFQLTMVDAKSNTPLWTITSPVNLRGRRAYREHWITLAETNLVSRIQVVAGAPLTPEESADLTKVPPRHWRRNAIIGVSAAAVVGVAGGLILHHEYENSLANQKSSQDAFCIAHNIPLSQCAGG